MIEKIKDINPSIPGMLIVQLLYLIVYGNEELH